MGSCILSFLAIGLSNLDINIKMSTKRPAEDEKVKAKKAKLDENAASKLVEEYVEEEEDVLDGEDEEEYGDEEEDLDDEEEDGEEHDEEEDGEHEEEDEEDGEDGEEEDEDQ